MDESAPHIEAHVRTKAKLLARFKAQGTLPSKEGLPPGQTLVKKWVVLDMRPPDFYFELDEKWRLTVSQEKGEKRAENEEEVVSSHSLSLEEIRSFCSPIRTIENFHCVTSWSALGIELEGIKFSCLLKRLAISEQLRWVVLRGADGYSTYVPREEAEEGVLVWGFWDHKGTPPQGEGNENSTCKQEDLLPLGLEHGSIRIFFPQLYGWKSAKWLVHIHFTRNEPREGFWETRGWHSRGRVDRQERYDDPNHGSAIMFYPLEFWLTTWARFYPQGVHAIQKTLSGHWGAFLNPHYWLFAALAGPIFPWYLLYQTLMYGVRGESKIYRGSIARYKVVVLGMVVAFFWTLVGFIMPVLASMFVPASVLFQYGMRYLKSKYTKQAQD